MVLHQSELNPAIDGGGSNLWKGSDWSLMMTDDHLHLNGMLAVKWVKGGILPKEELEKFQVQ